MRKLIVAAALVLAPSLAQAAQWEIDPVHSTVNFTVKHMMVSNVRGQFTKLNGMASWDKPDGSDAKIEVTIDANSIDTREPKRDAHLKSPDFLDAAKFPTLTFKSKKVEPSKTPGHLALTGELTIHGVTKEVTFDVVGPTPEQKAFGQVRVGADATTKINRKDFGLNWNKTIEAGGLLVGNEVTIEIAVEMVKKQAAKAER